MNFALHFHEPKRKAPHKLACYQTIYERQILVISIPCRKINTP